MLKAAAVQACVAPAPEANLQPRPVSCLPFQVQAVPTPSERNRNEPPLLSPRPVLADPIDGQGLSIALDLELVHGLLRNLEPGIHREPHALGSTGPSQPVPFGTGQDLGGPSRQANPEARGCRQRRGRHDGHLHGPATYEGSRSHGPDRLDSDRTLTQATRIDQDPALTAPDGRHLPSLLAESNAFGSRQPCPQTQRSVPG